MYEALSYLGLVCFRQQCCFSRAVCFEIVEYESGRYKIARQTRHLCVVCAALVVKLLVLLLIVEYESGRYKIARQTRHLCLVCAVLVVKLLVLLLLYEALSY